MPIFTFALGTWQLQRLQWKVNLIDELQEKLEREPISLPRHVKSGSFFFLPCYRC
jgi:surfeit locus 1 family protein